MNPLENPEVAAEVSGFLKEERARCLQAYELYLQEGCEPMLASRSAVAAVLQEQRMNRRLPDKLIKEMLFWYEEYKKTMTPEEADNKAWQRIMKGKR